MNEVARIKKAYEIRKHKADLSDLYSFFNRASLYISQGRERAILEILPLFNISDISDKTILDLGCGSGGVLRDFLRYGATPENCYGVDLLPERIEVAKRLSPNIDFICGNAEKLPYEDYLFDIVLSFTVFSSILDLDMKRNIAHEMLRILNRKGVILWYDFHMNNPQNKDVRAIKKKEIRELFSNCDIYVNRITLAPPIVRMIAPYSWLISYLLEKLKIFNTHYIGVISKKSNHNQNSI